MIWAFFVSICFVLLTGCGADVNSELNFRDDHSGKRLFALTVKKSDAEILSGGIQAATEVLEKHLPEVLTFEGVETVEEGYIATFYLEFNSPEEYQNKITALLEASDVPEEDRTMTLQFHEDGLLSQAAIEEEDFFNDDLMRWAEHALIADEIVSPETTVLTSSGLAEIFFDGEQIPNSTSLPRINFDMTQDRRFSQVDLDIEIIDFSVVEFSLNYLLSDKYEESQRNFIDQQIQQLKQLDDTTVSARDFEHEDISFQAASGAYRVTARFQSEQAANAGLQILLVNDEATFETLKIDQPDGAIAMQYSGENLTCEAICDPTNLKQLQGETIYPQHWEVLEDRRDHDTFRLEVDRGITIDAFKSITQLEFAGSFNQTFEYTVQNSVLEGNEDQLAARLVPEKTLGDFTTEQEGQQTVFTATFQADSAAELSETLTNYFEDKNIEEPAVIGHQPLRGFWATYDLEIDLSPLTSLTQGGAENSGDGVFEVHLPPLHTGTSSHAHNPDSSHFRTTDGTSQFTIHGNGPTLTTLWSTSAVIVLIATVTVVLLRIRKAATKNQWAVPSARSAENVPYNIQGPKDRLTASDVLPPERD